MPILEAKSFPTGFREIESAGESESKIDMFNSLYVKVRIDFIFTYCSKSCLFHLVSYGGFSVSPYINHVVLLK